VAASAVLYVKDLQSMRDFYERCFAMSAEHADKRFCVLASPDWELSLVRVADRVAAAVVIADPPLRREDSPIKLVFDVSDLDHAVSLVVAAGGQIDPADPVWRFRDRLHRDCLDPEGNVLQLRQPLRT
jgi:predicted enzyme related to lactoylglutathione lyase